MCVFDQALYAKAAEVIWKQPQQFCHIVRRLGVFARDSEMQVCVIQRLNLV